MLRLRRPSASEIARLLATARDAAPTYPEVGATRHAALPGGYRHDHYERRLGAGDAVFDRAVEALATWEAQIGAGAGSRRMVRASTRRARSSCSFAPAGSGPLFPAA